MVPNPEATGIQGECHAKSQLQKSLKEHVSDDSDMKFGYIEPSKQGIRGKVRWIFTADDLDDMYTLYEQKNTN